MGNLPGVNSIVKYFNKKQDKNNDDQKIGRDLDLLSLQTYCCVRPSFYLKNISSKEGITYNINLPDFKSGVDHYTHIVDSIWELRKNITEMELINNNPSIKFTSVHVECNGKVIKTITINNDNNTGRSVIISDLLPLQEFPFSQFVLVFNYDRSDGIKIVDDSKINSKLQASNDFQLKIENVVFNDRVHRFKDFMRNNIKFFIGSTSYLHDFGNITQISDDVNNDKITCKMGNYYLADYRNTNLDVSEVQSKLVSTLNEGYDLMVMRYKKNHDIMLFKKFKRNNSSFVSLQVTVEHLLDFASRPQFKINKTINGYPVLYFKESVIPCVMRYDADRNSILETHPVFYDTYLNLSDPYKINTFTIIFDSPLDGEEDRRNLDNTKVEVMFDGYIGTVDIHVKVAMLDKDIFTDDDLTQISLQSFKSR